MTIEFHMILETFGVDIDRVWTEKSLWWWVVCSDYRVSSMSRPSDSEKEIEFYMTLETFEVDLERVWTKMS